MRARRPAISRRSTCAASIRILPLYFVVIGLSLLPHLLAEFSAARAARTSPLPIPWWAYALFIQNFWMALLGTFGPSGIGITWSLAIEEQFYLTIPLLIRKVRPRNLLIVLLMVIFCAPWLRVLLHSSMRFAGLASYVLTPARADASEPGRAGRVAGAQSRVLGVAEITSHAFCGPSRSAVVCGHVLHDMAGLRRAVLAHDDLGILLAGRVLHLHSADRDPAGPKGLSCASCRTNP